MMTQPDTGVPSSMSIPNWDNPQHPFCFGPTPAFDRIPMSMREGEWACWGAKPRQGKPGKWDKIPMNGFGNLSTASPEGWTSFEGARALYESNPGKFNGIGKRCVLGEGFTYIDVDGSLDDAWQQEFPTYWEMSPSGTGMRGISFGDSSRDIAKPIEIYSGHAARFVTVTGAQLGYNMPTDCTSAVEDYIARCATTSPGGEVPDEPVPPINEAYTLPYPLNIGGYGKIPPGVDRSNEVQRLANMLLHQKIPKEDVLSFLATTEWMGMALEHRKQDHQKAVAYLWRTVLKGVTYVKAPEWDGMFPSLDAAVGTGRRTFEHGLLDALEMEPPRFDENMWPKPLAEYAKQIANDVGVDALVPAFTLLWSLSVAVDKRSMVKVRPKWFEPMMVWPLLVGRPSTRKSPGSKPIIKMLADIQKRLGDQFDTQQRAYEQAVQLFDRQQEGDAPDADAAPESPVERPTPPQMTTLVMHDGTGQGVRNVLANLPRGCGIYFDEAGDFLTKQSAGMSDNVDRRLWVQSYGGGDYTTALVNAGRIDVDNLALSILGGVQPQVLQKIGKNLKADGLLQRFIPIPLASAKVPDIGSETPEWMDRGPFWAQLLERILTLGVLTIPLSPGARVMVHQLELEVQAMTEDMEALKYNEGHTTALGKLAGLTVRIAGLFHLIEGKGLDIAPETMGKAIRLALGYIAPAQGYFYNHTLGLGDEPFIVWLGDTMLAHNEASISIRDIKRIGRRREEFKHITDREKNELIEGTMAVFENAGWAMRDDAARAYPGHVVWFLNQEVQEKLKSRAADRKKRMQRVNEAIGEGVFRV